MVLEKANSVSGFVCLNDSENNLIKVDRIIINSDAVTILDKETGKNKINQVVLNGRNICFSILNESYAM